ncbi:hypothetical protein DFR70_103158 [Nocardia tenerifensis]|uniref:Uncharacterized protein n=1 Tax=Nocardia tenerifensis TaxID=228006 RepID=A0A318K4R8_9NOCA|nr:hypothetical protein [Nocardia tenerifensis]PXX66410.1 hypothetical protein DFR70_103158 [Nocardia tenerifensis]
MTSVQLDRRVSTLETRVTDIEDVHSETLYQLTRGGAGCRIETGRLIDHADSVSRAFTLIMERLGITPIPFPPVTRATEAEIDAALDANY